MLSVLVAAALASTPVAAAPAKPAASGFPDHDAQREKVVHGRVRASDPVVATKATTTGQWKDDGGRLSPVFGKDPGEQLWFPKADAAHLGEGTVRVRIDPGDGVDLSVLLRQRYQGDPPAVLSGYGLTIEGDALRFHRWDRGMVLPVGPEAKVAKLADRASLEIVIFMVGPQLVATVWDGETLAQLATLVVHDTTYAFGCAGFRVGPKHDPKGAITLLSVMDSAKHASRTHKPARAPLYGPKAAVGTTPFGNTRYAWVAAKDVARLPKDLRAGRQATIEDRSLLFLDTVGFERLRRAGVEVLAVDSNTSWSVFNDAFRRREKQPPKKAGRGFVLDDAYKDQAVVEGLLRAYHERYPKITALVEIGRTHQKRPIWALKISDAAASAEDEPAVLLNGAHHGSELLSIEYVLDAVDTLVAGYGHDARVKAWVDGLEIWCVPLVNPDGNHMFVHESRFAIRKNARDSDGDGYADPFEGVDLNRNYPFGWGEVGSSKKPMHKWYRGPAGGSEPETKALMELAGRERFAAAISFHTFGTEVFSSYVVETAKDMKPDLSKAIAVEITAASPVQPNERAYKAGKTNYPVAGTDQDWHLWAHGTIAYVLEGSHHNPPLDVRTQAVVGTRPVWQALFDRVVKGPWIHGHVRDASGKPIDAVVMIEEIATFEGERWTTRPRDGRFARAVPRPGTYTVVVTPKNGAAIRKTVKVGKTPALVDVVI